LPDIARFELPPGWTRSTGGIYVAGDPAAPVTGWPWRDFPILERSTAKRSNHVPEGSLLVTSFASTEAVDFFRTRVTLRFMDAAWPRYMSNPVQFEDGTWGTQGNLRYMHLNLPAGFCREYQRTERGYLCRFVIPPCFKSYQEQIQDGALTGTSLGFSPTEWERSKSKDEAGVIEFIAGDIAEQSIVDAPATPGCNFQEMAEHARHALGWSPRQFIGVTLPRAVEPQSVEDDGPLNQADLAAAAAHYDDEIAPTPAGDASAGGTDAMNWTEVNGFFCADLRPEGDFIADTLRYSAEDPSGIVRRGGKLREDLRGNEYDNGDRIQRICFNKRPGDGYSREEAELLVSIGFGCHWWDGEGVSLVDLPMARAKDSMFQRVIGKITGKEPNEIRKPDVINRGAESPTQPPAAQPAAAADQTPASGSPTEADQPPEPAVAGEGSQSKEDEDMDEKVLQEALQRSQQSTLDAIKGQIETALAAAVKPVADGVAALTTRVAAVEQQNTISEQERNAAGQLPRPGVGALPTMAPSAGTMPKQAQTGGAIRSKTSGCLMTRDDLKPGLGGME